MLQTPDQTRRDFLRSTAGAVTSVSLAATGRAAANFNESMIIDCHAHIYGEDEEKYPTIEDPYRPPRNKGTIRHLRAEMKSAGVRYVTAIQTSTYYRFDNRFTSESARDNSDFMAGVVTLDPDNPAGPGQLRRYVANYNVRGMRSIPARNGRLNDKGVERLWATAEELGIVINALVNRDKRPEIEALAVRHPDLRIVIDHCLNLKAGPTLEPTLQDVVALAGLPNVHAKLTFIPTGSAEPYPCRDMHEAAHRVIEAFGPRRCVWGSDFPCELWCPKVSYGQHLRIFTHELGLDDAARQAILGETAHDLWFADRDRTGLN